MTRDRPRLLGDNIYLFTGNDETDVGSVQVRAFSMERCAVSRMLE